MAEPKEIKAVFPHLGKSETCAHSGRSLEGRLTMALDIHVGSATAKTTAVVLLTELASVQGLAKRLESD